MSTLRCKIFGHKWYLEPPWSGREMIARPHCKRCGHTPDEIAITGQHKGDHRI